MREKTTGIQYTFGSFEVAKANRKAFENAKHFAENPDAKPLALFGGTATGKTHLLYAVKNAIEQNSPEYHVILTTASDLADSLADTIRRGGAAEQFRQKYMQADVLLVNDIQELAGKEKAQDELILLFNVFCESGKRFMMTSSQKEAHYGMKDRLVIRGFWGEFAVIPRAYIKAQFEPDMERSKQRADLLRDSERLYRYITYDKFSIESFKAYYKQVWTYFSRYIGFFDVDREDVRIISYLNRIDTMLHCKAPSGLALWERKTCILFMHALIYTISSYDIIPYRGGFYCKGILYIPLPHQAGTDDSIKITIDEFDEWFQKFCESYKKSSRRLSRLHWHFD